MAEAAVEVCLGKLVSLLEKEASLIGDVRGEIIEVQRELESMRSFLKVADRRESNEQVTTWVEQVRDVVYDVEDIIDEFMYHLGSQRKRSGFKGFFSKTVHILKNVPVRHHIATKLQEINTQIKAISERSKRYGVDRVEEVMTSDDARRWLQRHGESSLFMEDDDLVGIEKKRDLLLKWLMEGESRRTVISVCGMGGSGKTTLVGKVYKSPDVKRYFECNAWITVSQTYAIEELLRSMIKYFFEPQRELVPIDLSTMGYIRLVETLVNFLQQKRYVVVFDDVWDWDTGVWNQLKVALPDGGRGSRIMLTTRKEDIASFSFGVGSQVHHIQPLQEGEAWELFCKRAFSNRCCPQELESLARLIVEKCKGLPLAIVAMGGVMSSKDRTDLEWRRVYDNLNLELSKDPMVTRILLLSYNDLPHYLKPCFLYCCVFPEDHLIKRGTLITLWVAEGFVKQKNDMTPEEVAEIYLMELISRSMLQMAEKDYSGRPEACRMHDLMRELALSTSERENFCMVYDEREKGEDHRKDRRLSIQDRSDVNIQSRVSMSELRSFFVFVGNMISPSPSNGFPSGFRLLRVLYLEGLPIESVPDEVTNLFNLRYLNLRKTRVKELPKSLGRLQNLQTLDLTESKVEALPSGMVKLQNLRVLVISSRTDQDISGYNWINGAQLPVDVCKLKNLQALDLIEATDQIIKQVGNLTQLREFSISKVREEDGIELCSSIGKMNLLSGLFVMAINEEESLRMDGLSSPPPRLRRLFLQGKLEKVPVWIRSLQNLTNLYLFWSRLREDPFPHIQALPCLGCLYLLNAFEGQQLWFRAGSFQKLKELLLRDLPQLSQIIIEKGAMPIIQDQLIYDCRELKMVPKGIEHLTNMRKLTFQNASNELLERLRGEDSEDRPKVQHIPEIKNVYQTRDGQWVSESLSSVNTC